MNCSKGGDHIRQYCYVRLGEDYTRCSKCGVRL